MHYLYNLPRIPKDQVDSVEWTGDYISYDRALYLLGQGRYKKFVVLNSGVNPCLLKYIKNVPNTSACVVWYQGGEWIAKMFTTGWNILQGYLNVELNLDLDVVFISYGEANAEENWQRVLEKAPTAKRVDGVTGILEAHKAAADLVTTDMFYVVDGDAYLSDDWSFDFQPSIFDRDCVFVWHSQNPVNSLEYGYGGVKIFPTDLLKVTETWNIDLTTGLGKLKVISKISNTTAFNTDPFSAWRSAFRECAKLSASVIPNSNSQESISRLNTWTTVGADAAYGNYAIAGAIEGEQFGCTHQMSPDILKLINDREWLFEYFNNTMTKGI
jgi:hypothetical protein